MSKTAIQSEWISFRIWLYFLYSKSIWTSIIEFEGAEVISCRFLKWFRVPSLFCLYEFYKFRYDLSNLRHSFRKEKLKFSIEWFLIYENWILVFNSSSLKNFIPKTRILLLFRGQYRIKPNSEQWHYLKIMLTHETMVKLVEIYVTAIPRDTLSTLPRKHSITRISITRG